MQYTFIPFLNSMKSCPTNHISFSDNEVKHFYFNYYSKNLRYINLVQLFPNIISCDVCFFLQLLLLLFIVIIITIINFYCLLFIISFEYSRHSYGSALGCCIPLLDALIPIISFLVCNRCCCCGFLSLVERLIEYALLQRYYYLHISEQQQQQQPQYSLYKFFVVVKPNIVGRQIEEFRTYYSPTGKSN